LHLPAFKNVLITGFIEAQDTQFGQNIGGC
jgi:hypothetical protein